MRITMNSTLLAAAVALSLTTGTAFAQQAKTDAKVGAQTATSAIPATPAVPATPALPPVDGATHSNVVGTANSAEPASPAIPATPAVAVDGSATNAGNASMDPTAVARDHQSQHAVDGQAVSTDAKAEAEVKSDAKADARAAKKPVKKKKPF